MDLICEDLAVLLDVLGAIQYQSTYLPTHWPAYLPTHLPTYRAVLTRPLQHHWAVFSGSWGDHNDKQYDNGRQETYCLPLLLLS